MYTMVYPGWCTLHIPGVVYPAYTGVYYTHHGIPGVYYTHHGIPGWYRHLSDTRVVQTPLGYPGGIHVSHVPGWYTCLPCTRVVPTPLTYPGGTDTSHIPGWCMASLGVISASLLVYVGFSPVSARF